MLNKYILKQLHLNKLSLWPEEICGWSMKGLWLVICHTSQMAFFCESRWFLIAFFTCLFWGCFLSWVTITRDTNIRTLDIQYTVYRDIQFTTVYHHLDCWMYTVDLVWKINFCMTMLFTCYDTTWYFRLLLNCLFFASSFFFFFEGGSEFVLHIDLWNMWINASPIFNWLSCFFHTWMCISMCLCQSRK